MSNGEEIKTEIKIPEEFQEIEKSMSKDIKSFMDANETFYCITFCPRDVRLQGRSAIDVFNKKLIPEHFKITDHGFIETSWASKKFGKIELIFDL